MKLPCLIASLAFFIAFQTSGQVLFTCFDVNPAGWSVATGFEPYNGKLYFNAYTPAYGRELWVSDGTPAGTTRLTDINPGPAYSLHYDMAEYTGCNNLLFFVAMDSTYGSELWTTDGTTSGTQLLKDIRPGKGVSSGPGQLFAYGNKLLFSANDGVNGNELWVSDGTTGGTQMLKDINPGVNASSPSGFKEFNGMVYFSADDGVNGTELWVTDGTVSGTQMVADIYPGGDGNPAQFTVYNNRLYFVAQAPSYLYQVWSTDGTQPGTTMLKEINNAGPSTIIGGFTVSNNQLFFVATTWQSGTELYVTDGSVAGTKMVKDIRPYNQGSGIIKMIDYNNKIYFNANDGKHGFELWVSDGTDAGTYMISDWVPGKGGLSPAHFKVYKNYLYFAGGNTFDTDRHMFRTDGTNIQLIDPPVVSHTSPLFEFSAGKASDFAVFNSSLFFGAAYDSTTAFEAWALYDTANSAQVNTDIIPSKFEVFPNPGNGYMTLQFDSNNSPAHVSVFDMTGRVLYSKLIPAGNNHVPLNLTYLPQGMYQLKLQTNTSVNIKKVFIMH